MGDVHLAALECQTVSSGESNGVPLSMLGNLTSPNAEVVVLGVVAVR
jgi:hypothetical protein